MHGGWFEMSFRQLHSVISIVSPVNCSLSQSYEMSGKYFPNPSEKKQGDYNKCFQATTFTDCKIHHFAFCNSSTNVQNISTKFWVGQIKKVNWLKVPEWRLRDLILPKVLIGSKIRVTWPAQNFNYLLQSDSVINKTDYSPNPAL